jgi:hypothetical protein
MIHSFIFYLGIALQDRFSIECSDWIDEGVYADRNLTRDKKNGEPLTYLFETVTKRNLSTGIESVKTEVFRGGNGNQFLHVIQTYELGMFMPKIEDSAYCFCPVCHFIILYFCQSDCHFVILYFCQSDCHFVILYFCQSDCHFVILYFCQFV